MRVSEFMQTEHMALSGGDVIWVREIPSDRWDLAVGQLRDAGSLAVLDGEVQVGLHRGQSFPNADRRTHVTVFTAVDPQFLSTAVASVEVAAGRVALDRALSADARLREIFRDYGVVCEYVYDYGHGALLVGDISADWEVTLR